MTDQVGVAGAAKQAEELAIFKKGRRALREKPEMKYVFMHGNTGEFSSRAQRETFGAPRSGYPAWRHRRQHPIGGRGLYRPQGPQRRRGAISLTLMNRGTHITERAWLPARAGKGNCYDNACAESFFHTLRVELIQDESYAPRQDMRRAVFEYIEVDYNRTRRHSANGYISPLAYEKNGRLTYCPLLLGKIGPGQAID